MMTRIVGFFFAVISLSSGYPHWANPAKFEGTSAKGTYISGLHHTVVINKGVYKWREAKQKCNAEVVEMVEYDFSPSNMDLLKNPENNVPFHHGASRQFYIYHPEVKFFLKSLSIVSSPGTVQRIITQVNSGITLFLGSNQTFEISWRFSPPVRGRIQFRIVLEIENFLESRNDYNLIFWRPFGPQWEGPKGAFISNMTIDIILPWGIDAKKDHPIPHRVPAGKGYNILIGHKSIPKEIWTSDKVIVRYEYAYWASEWELQPNVTRIGAGYEPFKIDILFDQQQSRCNTYPYWVYLTMLQPPGGISAKVYEIGKRWRHGEKLLREQSDNVVAECDGSIVHIYPLMSIPIVDITELIIITLSEVEIHAESIIVSLQSTHPLTSFINNLKAKASQQRNTDTVESLQEQLQSVEFEQTKHLQRAVDLNLSSPQWVTRPLANKQRALKEKIQIMELTGEVARLKKELHETNVKGENKYQNSNVIESTRSRCVVLVPNSIVFEKKNPLKQGKVKEIDGDWISILWNEDPSSYPYMVHCPVSDFKSWPVAVAPVTDTDTEISLPKSAPKSSPIKIAPSSPLRQLPKSSLSGSFGSYQKSSIGHASDVRKAPPLLSTQLSSVSDIPPSTVASRDSSVRIKSIQKPAPKLSLTKRPFTKPPSIKAPPGTPTLFVPMPMPVTGSVSTKQSSLSPPASREPLNRTVPIGATVGEIASSSQDLTSESSVTSSSSNKPRFFINIKPPSDQGTKSIKSNKTDSGGDRRNSAAAAAAAAAALASKTTVGSRVESLTERALKRDDPLTRFRKRSSLSTHSNYSSTSPYTVVCKWCGQNATQEHELSRCAWRQISCHHCQTVMVARDYKTHLSGKCSGKRGTTTETTSNAS